jgi:two-component system OmpR family sensor kinase
MASTTRPYRGVCTSVTGQKYIYIAYSLSGLPSTEGVLSSGMLVLAISLREALSVWGDFIAPLLWAGLIAFAVSIIIAIFLARSVYRPIQRVTQAAGAIAEGDYDQEIPVGGSHELRELTSSFNRMAKEVKRSQQMLRDFIADASHELRSPLTAIKGFAQAIVDGTASDTESQRKAAGIIEDESQRMMRLVEDLLEFSRLESGQVAMVKEKVDVKELLQQCHELFSMRAKESGIELVLFVDEPLPPVIGDIDRLEQVVNNLVDNALKHTPEGGTVWISAAQSPERYVTLKVSDTGGGIPAEQLPHIFKRFYRADSPGGKSGAGLGLAIAREIIRAHGGTITVASVSGKGSTFSVNLPVVS